ncbi:cellulose binding domain-containing protein [Nonomuraea sp. SBT364]|uniref:cellulose binding domain-containing protein n=1 Tax=Nonomuraea sp. SBT364 TaxID=1580530 RepID=UPI00066E78CB|nr:cellulose binding domain-containing protein [Nonomuraea sp. SBT364]
MPQRDENPSTAVPQSDPFEVTGAFATPPRPEPGRPFPSPEQPFETTGAFVRPASWDDVPGVPDAPDAVRPPQDPPRPPSVFDPAPRDRTAVYGPPPGTFDQGPPPGTFDQGPPPGTFDQGRQADPFDQGPRTGSFDRAGADHPNPYARPGAFAGDEAFDEGPAERTGAYDPFPGDRTARFDPPAGGPPEPGDVKVYGEPTMAAPTPAWAEAESGFLGSGWSSDGEQPAEPEPSSRRGRRKPPKDPYDAPSGGRGKLALLSVAAVAIVLGGTVAGVKMMSSGGSSDCPGGNCAAVQASNQPAPAVSEPEGSEPVADPAEDPLEEEPTEKESEPADTPEPRVTDTPVQPRRTPTPSPKPTKTKSKQAQEPVEEPVEDIIEEAPTETPSEAISTLGDAQGRPTQDTAPQATATATTQMAAGGSSVQVDFDVVKQGLTGYTAALNVRNSSAGPLKALTLSLPVRGRVTDVDGAGWTQDGNLLIVDLSTTIATGGSSEITIKALGRAGQPRSCGMVGGECSVS